MMTEPNAEVRKAGFESGAEPAETLGFPHDPVGQTYPQHYPPHDDQLGEPLTIRDTAKLLGCSPWTVRHSYMPKGLPHLRSGPLGKLIFYRAQIVRWILQYQRKGGR